MSIRRAEDARLAVLIDPHHRMRLATRSLAEVASAFAFGQSFSITYSSSSGVFQPSGMFFTIGCTGSIFFTS